MVGCGLMDVAVNKMTSICFYISDYGYGHASRDIAIIRRILDELSDIKIYVKTDGPFHFVRQSLPPANVEVVRTKNDAGVVFKENSVSVDRERTKNSLNEWAASWDDYIHSEKRFCEAHKIDLILSDITPQPFVVADELNIPSAAISNFTWHYIFYNLFGDVPVVERIKEAYQHADLALTLPFNEEMDLFENKKEVNLISREMTVGKQDVRERYNISDDELLVYVGVGLSFDPSFMLSMEKIDIPNVKFLISSNAELPFEDVIKIPTDETETQNYIGMCDLVVSKTGYGTMSEAIRARIPMFLLKRDGFKEDELIGGEVEKMGIGKFISERSFLNGDWIERLNEVKGWGKKFDNIPKRFKDDGTHEVVDAILNSGCLEEKHEANSSR
jgi:uncharacterized protein (TIGR00661 family)